MQVNARKHFENTPIQYNGTFYSCKNETEKMWSFLLFLLETEIVDTR